MSSVIKQPCELCGIMTEKRHKHHLIPRELHEGLDRKTKALGIKCCWPCSNQIHLLHSNQELKERLNTLEKLKSDKKIQKWIFWKRRHPEFMKETLKVPW